VTFFSPHLTGRKHRKEEERNDGGQAETYQEKEHNTREGDHNSYFTERTQTVNSKEGKGGERKD